MSYPSNIHYKPDREGAATQSVDNKEKSFL